MAFSVNKKLYEDPTIDDDMIDPDDADLNDFDDPLDTRPLTGTLGSSSSSSSAAAAAAAAAASSSRAPARAPSSATESYLTSRIPGEDRHATQSTIDETVWATLRRDLLAIWGKMREVLWPRYILGGSMFESANGLRGAYANLREAGIAGAREELSSLAGRVMDAESLVSTNHMTAGLRNWDLWGPLIFCLALSVLLSIHARPEQKDAVFSGIFAMVWIGEAVVTLQIRLLGGSISFAQSICIIGYTLFPLVIAALLSAFRLYWIARIPVYIVLVLWSMAAGISILAGSGVVKNRVALAVYPLLVFYIGMGCLCFIS